MGKYHYISDAQLDGITEDPYKKGFVRLGVSQERNDGKTIVYEEYINQRNIPKEHDAAKAYLEMQFMNLKGSLVADLERINTKMEVAL